MFITFEGIDGAGKSTHIEAAVAFCRTAGLNVVATREPGGTGLGEKLRQILLNEAMDLETEALLMFAARKEHIAAVIQPALARGDAVICDRFTDATFAYQGAGRGIDWQRLEVLEDWVQQGLQPDLTIVFDLSPAVAAARMEKRAGASDKFELESTAFFERVRGGYLKRAAQVPGRYLVINAEQSIDAIRTEVLDALQRLIKQ